jgi:hypothetical protein
MQAPGVDHICALGFIPGDRPGQARCSGADRGAPPGGQLQGGARICARICARSPAVPPGAGEQGGQNLNLGEPGPRFRT